MIVVAGALSLLVSVAVLLGWWLDIAVLKSLDPDWVSIKPNTALSFGLIGVALMLAEAPRPSTSRYSRAVSRLVPAARAAGWLAGTIGLLTLSQYLFDWNLGIDQALFSDASAAVATSHPGRMAPDTAICFVFMAAGLHAVLQAATTKGARAAASILGSLVVLLALTAIVAHLSPSLRSAGWLGLTSMSPITASVFTLLGTALIGRTSRGMQSPALHRFAAHLWRTAACAAVLSAAFVAYARAERQIVVAYEQRFQAFLLADELRHSGDDLTRMARTYAATGDRTYEQRFNAILDIREGRTPRPLHYWRPYWDLMPGNVPPPRDNGPAVALLELMRQAGFTDVELARLAEAKLQSDRLTVPEFEAMKLLEEPGPQAEADRARALAMLFDADYHLGKAAVMGSIDEAFAMAERRTAAAVESAAVASRLFRMMFAAAGAALMFFLWRTYVALGEILGGSVDAVHAHLTRIGQGDFSAAIPVRGGNDSVMAWLSETQLRLSELERERRRSEEVQRASERRYRNLFESMDQGFCVLELIRDADGKAIDALLVEVNPAFVQQAGVEGAAGKTLRELVREPDLALLEIYRQVTDTGEALRMETFSKALNRSFDIYAFAMAGTERGRLGVLFTDITEIKRARQDVEVLNAALERRVAERTAQLEESNAELEAFSYSVSHDLRAPLRAIDGYGRMLREDYERVLDGEGRRLLGVIGSETRRMGELIDDLLTFSRLGRQSLQVSAVDMTELVRAVCDEQAALVPDRALQLKLDPLPPAAGDRSLLRVVMTNLVSNAIKFTQGRTPAVIEIGARLDGRDTIYYVKDNGVGFDMAYAGKLFGVFQRLHAADRFDGTGVGLALAQRVVNRHGGRIWAEGRVDEGATFLFSLPGTKDVA